MNQRFQSRDIHPKLPLCWSRDETCLLLKVLRHYPIIYDPNHPAYELPTLRTKAYQQIADKLKTLKPDMSANIVKNKVKVLKKQYLMEKKMKEEYLMKRRKADGPYKPKLWCYRLMNFFEEKRSYSKNKQEMVASSTSSLNENDDCIIVDGSPIVEDEVINVDQENTIASNKDISRRTLNAKCLQLINDLTDTFNAVRAEKEKEANHLNDQLPQTFLGLMIQSELSNVSEEIYDEAKWKIIHILEEASQKYHAEKTASVQFKIPPHPVATSAPKSSLPSSNKQLYVGKGVKVMMIKGHGSQNSTITKFDSIGANSNWSK